MTAILMMCGATMMLTSCSKVDNPNTNPNPLAETLSGTWYSVYDAAGTAKRENGTSATVDYTAVIDVYRFQEDGRGDFLRFFFDQDNLELVLAHGILGYGDFTYRSETNGTVSIALKNNWGQSYPQRWNVTYAAGAISARGVDGRELKFKLADDETKAVLNNMAEQNGGGPKYDVDDYKPKDVDNSQWMKSLQDNRLVANLSLPGSHDACTAEGWQSKLLGSIAEASAKTQDLTIREQLKVGMRVFDIRPERVFETTKYVLRCSHGMMFTNMMVSDFFQQLKEFLTTNPTEFCILTVDLSYTADKKAWGKEFTALISSDEFRSMFVDFKPRLTVGDMRGKVLILSKWEYAEKPIGGYCYGWVYDQELERQQQGHITNPEGIETPLWVQDFWGKSSRDGKDQAVVRMLEAASQRDMTVENPAWVINYPSAYFGLPLSDSYRENAVEANVVAANWLTSHTGSVGIIYMDFAGMDKSPSYSTEKLYETNGMNLVDRVIKQNWK